MVLYDTPIECNRVMSMVSTSHVICFLNVPKLLGSFFLLVSFVFHTFSVSLLLIETVISVLSSDKAMSVVE